MNDDYFASYAGASITIEPFKANVSLDDKWKSVQWLIMQTAIHTHEETIQDYKLSILHRSSDTVPICSAFVQI